MIGFALGWLGSGAALAEIARGRYLTAALDVAVCVVAFIAHLRLLRRGE